MDDGGGLSIHVCLQQVSSGHITSPELNVCDGTNVKRDETADKEIWVRTIDAVR